jgi:hypothetical protein
VNRGSRPRAISTVAHVIQRTEIAGPHGEVGSSILPVGANLDRWLRGLKRRPAKTLGLKLPRRFESAPIRQICGNRIRVLPHASNVMIGFRVSVPAPFFTKGGPRMSVAQNRAARRRMRIRYGTATRKRNVADIIAEERRQSLKESQRKVAKK